MAGKRARQEWRKPGRRQGYRVLAPERHLIVCEGKKTEPFYFEGLRDALKREFRNRIHIVVKGTGLHTTDLLDYASRECRKSSGYDHVWIAYDLDDFDPQDFDSVAKACARYSSETTAFHPLWSNSCIEIWILLHFGYTTAEMTTAEAFAKTNDLFRKEFSRPYEKNDKEIFARLSSRLEDAECNAARLIGWHSSQGTKRPSQMNPGTTMYEIIKSLRGYIEI